MSGSRLAGSAPRTPRPPRPADPMSLGVEELLLGGRATHDIVVPPDVLAPAGDAAAPRTVVLRPLVLADVQRIQRAGRDDDALTSVLMVQQAMVDPVVTLEQVNQMHCGLVEFLVGE